MGTFNWPVNISSMDRGQTMEIEATVDTGAAYTTLPARLLRELGIEPTGQRKFLLADGRRVYMDYGQAWATIDGESVITIVVFGDASTPPLMGAYTLEGLALAVDPVEQRLVPTHLIMYETNKTGSRALPVSGSRPSPQSVPRRETALLDQIDSVVATDAASSGGP